MDLELLTTVLAERGEPGYRARQVWAWAARGAGAYDQMTDLPAALRARLADEVPFSTLEVEREAHARDGTIKALFRTHDGRPVEAVLMRYGDGRRSLCLSSQSGCPLTCTFCATGTMRFGRNLTAAEIVDQALHFRRVERVDHAVFMGMGEPMMNLPSVLAACERLPDLGIAHRRTAISTVGWVPGIDALAQSEMPIRLALSLHAPEDVEHSGQRRARVDAGERFGEHVGRGSLQRHRRGEDRVALLVGRVVEVLGREPLGVQHTLGRSRGGDQNGVARPAERAGEGHQRPEVPGAALGREEDSHASADAARAAVFL